METKVLLVGESWVSSSTHLKGFDFFVSNHYAAGGDFLIGALRSGGIEVVHQPSHEAAKTFPLELSKLELYDVIILSDIGANTLLLPPEVFLEGKRVPNRLGLIKEYVRNGGGLIIAVVGIFVFKVFILTIAILLTTGGNLFLLSFVVSLMWWELTG